MCVCVWDGGRGVGEGNQTLLFPVWPMHRCQGVPKNIVHDNDCDRTVEAGDGMPHLGMPDAQLGGLFHNVLFNGAEDILD